MSTYTKHNSSGMSNFQAAKSSSMESLESSMSTTESTTGRPHQRLSRKFIKLTPPPPPPPPRYEDIESARLATVIQENAVLKSELELLRLKCKNLVEENKRLRQASVTIVSVAWCACSVNKHAYRFTVMEKRPFACDLALLHTDIM